MTDEPNAEFSGVAHGTVVMPDEDDQPQAVEDVKDEEPQAEEQEGPDDA